MESRIRPQDRLDGAATIEQVVAAVREYVLGLTPRERDRLPRHHRPTRIDDAQAIHQWAEQLARYEMPANSDPFNMVLFQAIREYFGRASRRVAGLARETSDSTA